MPPIPFEEFTTRVLALYQPPLRAPLTLQKMRLVLSTLATVPGIATTADLTTDRMALYLALRGRTVCATTLVGEVGYLRSLCAFAVAEGYLDRPPQWRRILPRRSAPLGPGAHEPAEIGRLLDHLEAHSLGWQGHRLYALTALVCYTGLRRAEALHLQVGDVRLAERLIWVVPRRRLKTEASAAPVGIAPELSPILAAWVPRTGGAWLFPGARRRGPWTGGAKDSRALERLQAAARAVGIGRITWRSLRHTVATHGLRRCGMSREEVRDLLRHADVTTQRHYLHRDLDALARSVEGLSYPRSG